MNPDPASILARFCESVTAVLVAFASNDPDRVTRLRQAHQSLGLLIAEEEERVRRESEAWAREVKKFCGAD